MQTVTVIIIVQLSHLQTVTVIELSVGRHTHIHINCVYLFLGYSLHDTYTVHYKVAIKEKFHLANKLWDKFIV